MSQRVLSFHYVLTDSTGREIDSSKGRGAMSYMEGAQQIIPGLEKELGILKKGDKKKILVLAAEAYGLRDEKKVIQVPRHKLPSQEIKIGDQFAGGEGPHAPVFTVTRLAQDTVTLDGNHSLAGMDLTFDVELTDVREATQEEISHGHAHGEHGHSH